MNPDKEGADEEDHTAKQDEEDATEQATEHVEEHPEEDRSSSNSKGGKTFNRFTAKFNKQNSSKEETDSEGENKTDIPATASRSKLFSASERTPGIASHFVPKVKQVAEGSTTTTSTTLTSSTTTASIDETSTRKKTFGKDLLSSIPIEDDISALLPEGFNLKPETSSIGFVQVNKSHLNFNLKLILSERKFTLIQLLFIIDCNANRSFFYFC